MDSHRLVSDMDITDMSNNAYQQPEDSAVNLKISKKKSRRRRSAAMISEEKNFNIGLPIEFDTIDDHSYG